MDWDDVVEAARTIAWATAFSTTGRDGRPAVSFVAPGFAGGRIYVGTRPGTRKVRNLAANAAVAMHWPVTTGGPGQLFIRGTGAVRSSPETKAEIWDNGGWSYDLTQFFQSVDNPDLVFIEVTPVYASLLGPDFVRRTWRQ
ncbi:MAG: pyridoxamine 5'-phosphate oxidase family protein [Acidimicrobiia bacterium]|nr:pyridoxamine 5'-phosphate oxidase family protein [Acidimicrobiia bacterium]